MFFVSVFCVRFFCVRFRVYLWLRVCFGACFDCFGVFLLITLRKEKEKDIFLREGAKFSIYLVLVPALGFDFVCSCCFVAFGCVFLNSILWRLWSGLCFCQKLQCIVFVFVSFVVSVFLCSCFVLFLFCFMD